MVQWNEKPAPRCPVSDWHQPETAHPQVRKARKSPRAGALPVLTVCAVFALLIGGYALLARGGASPAGTSHQTAKAQDATGRIVIKDQAHCRELGFDNQSGKMVQRGAVSCQDAASDGGTTTQSLYRHPTNRLESIRKSFTR